MQPSARLGITLLMISESIFFFMLVLAFVVFRTRSVADASQALSLPLASISTSCLLVSSFTVWRAARISAGAGDANPRIWLVSTALLGALFLVGQGSEYLRLMNRGVTLSGSLFGTTFFTLTGAQALHVVAGILLLLGLLRSLGSSAPLSTGPAQSVQTVAAFWHFVAAVWVVIFLVVYLGTFL
jgi:cytochrome c oxidase subunit III